MQWCWTDGRIPLIPRHGSELEEGHEAGGPAVGCSWVLTRSWRGAGMLTAPWGMVLVEAFAEVQWVRGEKKKKSDVMMTLTKTNKNPPPPQQQQNPKIQEKSPKT